MGETLFYLALYAALAIGALWLLLRRWRKRGVLAERLPAGWRTNPRMQWLLTSPETQPTAQPREPKPTLTLNDVRAAATLLLAAGILLVWLTLTIAASLPEPERPWAYALAAVGGCAFLLGGRLMQQRDVPAFVWQATGELTRFLNVSRTQLLLLGLALPFSLLARLASGIDLAARHPWIATGSWLLAIGLAIAGASRRESADEPLTRIDWAWLVGLGLAAVLLRALWMTQFPNTLSGDEASSGLMAARFWRGEVDNLFTFGWFSFPSLYFAVQGLGIGLFGQTTEALRITSALAGAATIPVIYLLGRSMYGRLTGILAAGYLAAAHFHIHMSRIGLNNIWDGLMISVVVLGLWHGWQTGRRRSFVIAGIALGLAPYFYVSIRILPLLLLLWAALAWLIARPKLRQRLGDLWLTAFLALVVFLPLAILFAQRPDDFAAPLQRVTATGDWLTREMVLTGLPGWRIILEQMWQTALGFTHTPLDLLYNPGVPLLLPAAAGLFLLGVAWSLLNFDLRSWLLLLPLLAVVILGGFSQSPPASQRFVLCIPFVAIILARPLAQAAEWLVEAWPRYRPVIFIGLAVATSLVVVNDVRYYFFDVYDSYVLGGGNTLTATAIAEVLQDESNQDQRIWFFGLPRMGYFSLSTLPYSAPTMLANDIADPVQSDPGWPVEVDTLFIFLPERLDELEVIRAAYPTGTVEEYLLDNGQLDFVVYRVAATDPPKSN